MHLDTFFQRYRDGLSHHKAAVQLLQDALPPELLEPDADWIVCFEAEPDDKIRE